MTITSEGDGTSNRSGTFTVDLGSSLTIAFTPEKGSELKEVRVNGSLVNVSSDGRLSMSITSDTRIHAVFSPQQTEERFTLNVYSEGGGYAYGSGEYSKGDVATINAEPFSGYQFKQWSDGSKDRMRSITVTTDITLSASFSKDGSPFGGSTMNGDIAWIIALILMVIIVIGLIAAFMTRRGG